jgi:hypothetical protein
MKQTAVEWLEQQLFNKRGKFTKGDIDQAKAMEKEQIVKAYESLEHRHGENYYNETFNKSINNKG